MPRGGQGYLMARWQGHRTEGVWAGGKQKVNPGESGPLGHGQALQVLSGGVPGLLRLKRFVHVHKRPDCPGLQMGWRMGDTGGSLPTKDQSS